MLIIDKDKNRLFYESYTPCDCGSCKSFCSQIKSACKELTDFFAQYDIDITKPFELIPIRMDNITEYVSCQYLVFGECSDDFNITVGGMSLTKNADCHPSTKEYAQPNFILDFSVTLPNLIKE